MSAEKILFGGSGKFGREFLKQQSGFSAPTHQEVDITDKRKVREYLNDNLPEVVVHAAAVVGTREAEADPERTCRVNVAGTANIVRGCRDVGARLIYLSSVAVFDGEKGLYREEDVPNPVYFYGLTKLWGEESVRAVGNHVIVRTDFFSTDSFKYQQVLTDHYSSKMPVSDLVWAVGKLVDSDFKGVIHVGARRDTLYNLLKPHFPNISGVTIAESSLPNFPRDLSLDISLYERMLGGGGDFKPSGTSR